ncbi:MAG: SURF1 family protein [Rubrivivax sp.]|jgi:surfeit locus 1 family protein
MPTLTTRRWVVLGAAVLGVLVTARLGWWQLDRAAQKQALQQALDSRRAEPPLPAWAVARGPADAALQVHRATVLEGRWLPESTLYLENRQMRGRPGFVVVSGLQLPDGMAVLVQRGWLPRDLMDRTAVKAPPLPGGMVQVAGRLAPAPGRLYEFSGAASGPIRQNLDFPEFAAALRLPVLPLSLVQEDGPLTPVDGLLRDWPRPAADLHKHHGYAFQWFALASLILGLYVWFQILRPRFRR